MSPSREAPRFRLLVIDDTPAIHDDFRRILGAKGFDPQATSADPAPHDVTVEDPRLAGFSIDSAYQGQEGLAMVRGALAEGEPYALVFVDIRMPPATECFETVRDLCCIDPNLQVVICTAYSDHSWADTIRQLGSSDNIIILKKPFDDIEILQLAHALTHKWELARRLTAQMQWLSAEVERRTTELRTAEVRFATAFSANPVALTIQYSTDHRYLVVNPAFLALTGQAINDVVGHTPDELGIWPEAAAVLKAAAQGERVRKQALKLKARDGTMHDVLVSTEPITVEQKACTLWILDDISERLELEKQLLQAQKMESVGQLAAGIAHDFNNLLTAISVYTAEGLRECAPQSALYGDLLEIQAASRRAAALTRQLLIFSRRQFSKLAPLEVPPVLQRILPMLQRVIGEDVELSLEADPALSRIMGDESNIEHIVLNLVLNSRDALPDGGEIRITLREKEVDDAQAQSRPNARTGRFVVLAVADNGCGIPLEIQDRIFEPLFTTKESGKGTGLGLSTVDAIVRQHSGWIDLASAPGQGSVFEIYFPAAEPVEDRAVRVAPRATDPNRWRGTERILVAEDDAVVRSMLTVLFKRYGYQATVTCNGPEALEAWQENEGRFDLLVTDIVMPKGMNGIELASKLRALDPKLKVILTTGYSAELMTQSGVGQMPGALVLLKPYRPDALLRAVRNSIDRVPI